MRSGLIIYVVGKEPPGWNVELEVMTVKKNAKVDLVEIITANTGHFDVLDAWWSLLTKGMKKISCMIGEISPEKNICLTGRELHLYG